MVACLTPQAWHAFASTYYGRNNMSGVASIDTAVLPRYDTFNRHAPPAPIGSAQVTHNCDELPQTADGASQFHAARLFGHKQTPLQLRRSIRGKAYQRCIFETTGPTTRLCEMKTHLRHQGFNNESGLGLGLRPTNYAIYAMCARHSLVGVTSNTSHGMRVLIIIFFAFF